MAFPGISTACLVPLLSGGWSKLMPGRSAAEALRQVFRESLLHTYTHCSLADLRPLLCQNPLSLTLWITGLEK